MSTAKENARRILFVDDEENILSALKRELRPWAKEHDITIETTSSAQGALDLLKEHSDDFHVVVSDLRMPVMRGSDLLVEIRDKWPEIVTMLLSGYSEVDEIMKAVKAGAFSYLLKPWDTEYLTSELEKSLEHYTVKKENKRYRAVLEEELRWAGEMQRALLKPNPLKAEGVEFRSSWRPVPGLYCCGDYYDVIYLSPGRYLMIVGDVAGHGVRGALVTGILKAIIYPEYVRNTQGKRFSPGAFLSWLNDRLNFELRKTSGLVVCFFAGVLDRGELSFTYANAGMEHPYLVRNGQPVELPASGHALGVSASVMYPERLIQLQLGDVIFAYSDGLVEHGASNIRISIKDALAAERYGADYHRRIMDAALSRMKQTAFTDDVTITTARVE